MKIENRQRFLLVAAVALIAVFVLDQFVVEPLGEAWSARAEQIRVLQKKVADGGLLLQREAGLRNRWRQMRDNTLSDNPSLAEQQLLKSVDAWAQDSRVKISALTPQWKTDADEYRTLGCRVDASGNLGAVSKFLYELEKGPQAIKLETVELVASDATGSEFTLGARMSGLVLTPGGTR